MRKVIDADEFNNFESIICCYCYKSGADTLLFRAPRIPKPDESDKLVWIGDAYHFKCIEKAHGLFATAYEGASE